MISSFQSRQQCTTRLMWETVSLLPSFSTSIGVLALTAPFTLGEPLRPRKIAGLILGFGGVVIAMHVPNLVFVYLAFAQPASIVTICAALAIEQFGYGFGFSAFLLFMGIQFIVLGLLAELSARTYYEAQGKQIYNIKEKLNFD